jgi:hypothetical protein
MSDRMSRQEWERIKVEDFDRLEADLTQAQAMADALAVENAELRSVIEVQEFDDGTWHVSIPYEHWDTVAAILAADPAQRGADLIAAADAMAEQIEELNGEYLGCELAAQAYRRLRGGRGPEGGDE